MGGNELEWIKTAWEAFKADVKTRLGIAIGCSIFLACRSYIEQLPGGKNVFSLFAVPALLICIIFWVSLVLDGCNKLWKMFQERKAYKMYVHYLLNLSSDKYNIVNDLYTSMHHQGEFKYNDTDIRDLMKKGIIELAQSGNIISKYEINDPTLIFLLTPTALDAIKNNYDKFKR